MNTLKVDIIEKVDKLGYSHFQKLVSDWCGRSAELKSKIKSTDVEEQKRRSDAKAEGYEYIVSAYVHLESGGDDQRVSWFAKEKPSTLSVQNQLKKLKSIELNDYSIENI